MFRCRVAFWGEGGARWVVATQGIVPSCNECVLATWTHTCYRAPSGSIVRCVRGSGSLLIQLLRLKCMGWKARRDAAEKLGKSGSPRAIAPLVSALADSPSVAEAAADALATIGDERGVAALIAACRDSDWTRKRGMCAALSRVREPRAVHALIDALKIRDTHSEAAAALVGIGEAAVDPLLRALDEADDELVEEAVEVLGRIRSPRAVKRLVAILECPDTPAWPAEYALSAIGSAAVKPLLRLLEHPNSRVRSNAAVTLGHIPDKRAVEPLIKALGDQSSAVRWSAARALRTGNGRATRALIALLSDTSFHLREAAAESLAARGWKPANQRERALFSIARRMWKDAGSVGRKALEPLLAVLHNPDEEIRQGAAAAIGEIDDSGTVEPLFALMNAASGATQLEAALALARRGDSRAVNVLGSALEVSSLLTEGNERYAIRAAEALGGIRDPGAVSLLVSGLYEPYVAYGRRDSDRPYDNLLEEIWPRALESLIKIGPMAVEALISALKDPNEGRRKGAAIALGRIGDTRAITPLSIALSDKDSAVRKAVVDALTALCYEPADTTKQALLSVGRCNWDEAVSLGTVAIGALINALNERCHEAVAALVRIGEVTVVPLIEALSDGNISMRLQAADALLALGWQPNDDKQHAQLLIAREDWQKVESLGRVAVEPLIVALERRDRVSDSAAHSLGRLGDPRAVAPLIAALPSNAGANALARLEAASAVGPLVAQTAKIYCAASAVSALQKLLESVPGEVSVQDLTSVVQLGDHVVQFRFASKNCQGNYEDKISCSLLKQLARQELLRREVDEETQPLG